MNVAEFLQDAIVELKDVDEAALVPALTFEELELDSLDYVEIQLRIKKTFKVEITPELFASGQLKNLAICMRTSRRTSRRRRWRDDRSISRHRARRRAQPARPARRG